MKRSRLGLVLVFGVALNVSWASPDLSRVAAPTINWHPCAEFPGVDCATARVPLDYDNPDGPRTPLALARSTS